MVTYLGYHVHTVAAVPVAARRNGDKKRTEHSHM